MYITESNELIIEGIKDFDLEQTLECGQFFRFYKLDNNEYIVITKNKLLKIKQKEDSLIFDNTTINEYEEYWKKYFDLERDYEYIKNKLMNADENLKEAIQVKSGVRILNQDFFETLISFIISQNKQIPHIKQIIENISTLYGEELGEINGKKYYSFPSIERLYKVSESEFRECKVGFRAPYLVDACKKVYEEEITYEKLKGLPSDEVINELMKIKGVGMKVANCVILFGLARREAFPVDVWVKRMVEEIYFKEETNIKVIQEFAKQQFGDLGGYAQQYLFYYGRDKKSKDNKGKIKKN